MRKYDYAVVIGRFQPMHLGHQHLINQALKVADDVIVLVGSSCGSRTTKNPFTFEERERMINMSVSDDFNRVFVRPVKDYIYSDKRWLIEVQQLIDMNVFSIGLKDDPKVCIVGHAKDKATEQYLKLFPQYDYIEIDSTGPIDATNVRDLYFEDIEKFSKCTDKVLSKEVSRYLIQFSKTDEYLNLSEEYKFIKQYKKSWSFAPYKPTFVTTDAVVIESGHILLIKRGEFPGKGQWALPGGYLGINEEIQESCIRELHEETRLKVPKKVLAGSIKKQKVYAAVNRDPRGRFITHAFLFELAPCPDPKQKLTKVIASDDAAHAQWIPLSELRNMRNNFFLDHYDIIFEMIGG